MENNSAVAPVNTVGTNESEGTNKATTSFRSKTSSKGGWNAAFFIIFVEVAERFAFFGLAGNLITYLTINLHQSMSIAAQNVNTWIGVSSLFPVIGAFIADSYLGRFKTILFSTIIFLSGMILLTLSVSVVSTPHREAVFFIALYVLAVGEGGHKPCVQTFAADQFDEEHPEEKIAKSSFFNWWYLGIVFGATAATFVIIYVQDNIGWTEGVGMLAGAIALALLIFIIGIPRYRKEAPVGSPYTKVAQVFAAAMKKRNVIETPQSVYEKNDNDGQRRGRLLARTPQFRFLDKAMIIDGIDVSSKNKNPWRLCSLNQVEEVKQVLRLVPIWLSCLVFTSVIAQIHTFFTKQGSTMIRSVGPKYQLPPASLQGLIGIILLFAVPIYDKLLIPLARKLTGQPAGITMLQRIGFGLFLSILEMAIAALVESRRLKIASEHGLLDSPKSIVPMVVWWLLPQYFLAALCDLFTIVGLQELFYDQVPEGLRSMGAALYLSIVGLGSFISNAVIIVLQAITRRAGSVWLSDNLNRAHLDNYYWVMAVLSVLNFCVYLWISSRFVYKKVEDKEGEEMDLTEDLDGRI